MRLLNKLSLSEKLLHTGFIIMVCVGLLAAEAYLYVTHTGLDGKSGVTLKDIQISYYGDRSSSKLQTVLPTMLTNAGVPKDQWPKITQTIDHWVVGGQSKAEYESQIKPIIDQHCMMCHSVAMSKQLHNPPLASYDDVKKVAAVNTGMSYSSMLMGGMVHLTMLGVIFWIAGWIFLQTRVNNQIKAISVITPFMAMLLDYSGWFLTHMNPDFAWMVLVGGALSCPIAMLEMGVSLIDMWIGLPGFLQQRVVAELPPGSRSSQQPQPT
ncbi:hypothetical protein GALL_341840 [mine drainage metagenome]|uniref:Elongation factor-1 alpha n=1 Tax=mine drainage metagenome TaxID=410659 RepID=A0A1J5QKD3_9ZZZZ